MTEFEKYRRKSGWPLSARPGSHPIPADPRPGAPSPLELGPIPERKYGSQRDAQRLGGRLFNNQRNLERALPHLTPTQSLWLDKALHKSFISKVAAEQKTAGLPDPLGGDPPKAWHAPSLLYPGRSLQQLDDAAQHYEKNTALKEPMLKALQTSEPIGRLPYRFTGYGRPKFDARGNRYVFSTMTDYSGHPFAKDEAGNWLGQALSGKSGADAWADTLRVLRGSQSTHGSGSGRESGRSWDDLWVDAYDKQIAEAEKRFGLEWSPPTYGTDEE